MYLDAILAAKRVELARVSEAVPLEIVQRAAAATPPCRDFAAALRQPGLAVIAEVKRGSPSRGPIRPDLDAPSLARRYEAGGCDALSVLTDASHFGALPEDLPTARAAVGVPVLRKDFVLSEYQVWESRVMGADAVLLIVAALEAPVLRRLYGLVRDLGMCPLVEVHDEAELDSASALGATVIGVNNRNLHSFQVDLRTTERLGRLAPPDVALVSESGIVGPREAAAVQGWGASAILVGESLVRSEDPTRLVRELKSA